MKKFLLTLLITLFTTISANAAEPIKGMWQTIDDETGEIKSLVQIYETDGKYYGRVMKLFKNKDAVAKGVVGSPKIEGLDVIWNMEDTGQKYTGGKILDPKKGKVYTCEIWREGNNLIVRGKIGPFGRNQKWVKDNSPINDIMFIPQIPELE